MEKKKLSVTYRMLRLFGLKYSEEAYGDVSLWKVIKKFFGNIRKKRLEMMMDWPILQPIAPRKARASLLRRIGCHVGKNVFIGEYVRVDIWHADMVYIEDDVSIASGSRLLCHQRDFSNYCVGDNYLDLGYIVKPVRLCKGCLIGMESFVMPGVTVGEGAIVGAGSLVTKDVPAWTVVAGRPAKVLKVIPHREEKVVLEENS